MPQPPDPHDLEPIEILWIIGLSLLGGITGFIDKLRRREITLHWWFEMFADIVYSLAAGFMVYLMAIGWGICHSQAGAYAIIGGHFGARAINIAERKLLKRLFGLNSNDDKPQANDK